MSWLSDNKARLMLDIHLAEHIPKLFQSIQDRSKQTEQQYFVFFTLTSKTLKSLLFLLFDILLYSIPFSHHRCILKYVSPYVSLSLASMAESFNMDITSVESSVATLISDARLNARIDSAAKTVHVVSTERRAESFAKVYTTPLSSTFPSWRVCVWFFFIMICYAM